MTLTTKDKQNIVEALQEAKKILWDGNLRKGTEKFICICLEDVRQQNPQLNAGGMLAQGIVQSRVTESSGGFSTIENYLAKVLNINYETLDQRDIQEFRHRWVDHLIAEFSQ